MEVCRPASLRQTYQPRAIVSFCGLQLEFPLMEKQCFFNWKYDCGDKGDLTKAGPDRIRTIVKFSKEYKDNIHVDLVDRLGRNPELTIECHRSCVSTYTSQQHLNRYKKRICPSVSASQPSKRQCRSDVSVFSFKENCLFCGDWCEIEKDKKHPDRWKRAVLCRTAYAGPHKRSFKKSVLEVCTQRNDDIANQVRVRIEGALSDLHAADARYHVNCMTSFMSHNSISAAKNVSKENKNTDPAFDQVIDEMSKDRSRLWNSVELYNQYQLFGGKALLRRSLLVKIRDHFLDDIAILSSPGCQVLWCLDRMRRLYYISLAIQKTTHKIS
jgi:hypothetical protein